MMNVVFTVEANEQREWHATCKDPVLEVIGTDIIDVCSKMADQIENWFVTTFKTEQHVIVTVPAIKAKIRAEVSVRPETPLTEFTKPQEKNGDGMPEAEMAMKECAQCGTPILVPVAEELPLCDSCKYEQSVEPPSQPEAKNEFSCIHFSHGGDGVLIGTCNCGPDEIPITDIDGVCVEENDDCPGYRNKE